MPTIQIAPLVAYPRHAMVGKKYLMTIDLEWDPTAEEWPYAEDEYTIYFVLQAGCFYHETLDGEGAEVVITRSGRSKGKTRILLTPHRASNDALILVTMVNQNGVPMRTLSLKSVIANAAA